MGLDIVEYVLALESALSRFTLDWRFVRDMGLD